MALHVKWIVAVLVLVAGTSFAQEQIVWQTDIAKAVKQAKSERKLVLVHFYGDNCPPCRTVEQKVFPQPQVVQTVMLNYVPVKINVDQAGKIAARYGVRSIPTDIYLSGAGQEFHRSETKLNAPDFATLLDQLVVQTGIGAARQAALRERESRYDSQQATAEQPVQAQQEYVQNQYTAQNNPGSNRYAPQEPAQSQPEVAGMTPSETKLVYGGASAAATQARPQSGPYGSQLSVPPAQADAGRGKSMQDNAPQVANDARPEPSMSRRTNYQDPGDITARQPIRNQFIPLRDIPPFGMEGYCPVSVSPPGPKQEGVWKKGDPRFGAVHRGRTYLFASAIEQAKFLADPDAYSPVLSGADPVIFAETGKLVEGKRKLGIAVPVGEGRNEMYLFATPENLERFSKNPQQFAVTAHQAMLKGETERKYR